MLPRRLRIPKSTKGAKCWPRHMADVVAGNRQWHHPRCRLRWEITDLRHLCWITICVGYSSERHAARGSPFSTGMAESQKHPIAPIVKGRLDAGDARINREH